MLWSSQWIKWRLGSEVCAFGEWTKTICSWHYRVFSSTSFSGIKFDTPFGSHSTNENDVKKEEKWKNWKFFILFLSLIIKGKVVRKGREEKWSFISSPPHTQLCLQILPLLERNFAEHEPKSLACFLKTLFLCSPSRQTKY